VGRRAKEERMVIVMSLGYPYVMCDACFCPISGAGLVCYPSPSQRGHFPTPRCYCDQDCRERGERRHDGPARTVPWETFLQDLGAR
jgi:hypothetical protein